MTQNRETPESMRKALIKQMQDDGIEVIDIITFSDVPVYADRDHAYAVIGDEITLTDSVSVMYVRQGGKIFPSPEEQRRRWWICRYPTGTWDEVKSILKQDKRTQNCFIWKMLKVEKIFDKQYITIPKGYSFKIAKAQDDYNDL